LQMHVDAGAANFGSVAIPADDTCATATRTAVSVPSPSSRFARSTDTLSSVLREDEFQDS
jgi:hypothetical protein